MNCFFEFLVISRENFDDENPLIPGEKKNSDDNTNERAPGDNNECKITLDQFQEDTENEFQLFINELKVHSI